MQSCTIQCNLNLCILILGANKKCCGWWYSLYRLRLLQIKISGDHFCLYAPQNKIQILILSSVLAISPSWFNFAVGEGELDVQILRLVMFLESWQGLAEGCEIDKCIDENTTATQEVEISFSQGPRTGPEILKGVWKSYDISAVPVNDRDPLTGKQYIWNPNQPPTVACLLKERFDLCYVFWVAKCIRVLKIHLL